MLNRQVCLTSAEEHALEFQNYPPRPAHHFHLSLPLPRPQILKTVVFLQGKMSPDIKMIAISGALENDNITIVYNNK